MMTTTQVSRYLGMSRRETGRWLFRHGITALGREPGAAGQNLYPAGLVRNSRERPARAPYDRWRDARGVQIPDGARVEQVEVNPLHGALRSRLGRQGEVTGRSRGTRLYVRFHGEDQPVSIRPHLVRVVDS
jgi:hypothetical protein